MSMATIRKPMNPPMRGQYTGGTLPGGASCRTVHYAAECNATCSVGVGNFQATWRLRS